MTVYVLEVGEYSQRAVVGVYASLEAAKAVFPSERWVFFEIEFEGRLSREWDNDEGDRQHITEFEIQGYGVVR